MQLGEKLLAGLDADEEIKFRHSAELSFQHFFERAASMSDDNSALEADVVHGMSTTENREHHSRPDRVLTSSCMPPTKGGRSVWRKFLNDVEICKSGARSSRRVLPTGR